MEEIDGIRDIYNAKRINDYWHEKLLEAAQNKYNKQVLHNVIRTLKLQGLSIHRESKYMQEWTKFVRFLEDKNKTLKTIYKVDIEDYFLEKITHQTPHNTKREYTKSVKRLLGMLNKKELIYTVPQYKKQKAELYKIFSESDKNKILDTLTGEAKLLTQIYMETACRPGEAFNIETQNCKIYPDYVEIIVKGKTGERLVWVKHFKNELIKLINDRQGEKYLFKIKYGHYNRCLYQARKKLNIKIHAYKFRHTKATQWAGYLKEFQHKAAMGHGPKSKATAVYVHLNGRDVKNEILKIPY